ncbi:MAG TPA: hypothetical protein PLP73_02280 [Candidatus Absconditabacterales bacterium]|nr:hypothetical protein [Candidatus Absconditabacterales bacterium]
MKKSKIILGFLGLLAFLAIPVQASSIFSGAETIYVNTPVERNMYAAAGNLMVSKPIIAFGESISISSNVNEDFMGFGTNIYIDNKVAGDVRIAGQNIIINQDIGGDFIAFGASVTVAPDVKIGGDFVVYGATVNMNGTVNGNAYIGSAGLSLNGQIKGNAKLNFEEIKLGDGAKINGSLSYKAPQTNTELEGISNGEITFKASIKEGSQKFFFGLIKGIVFYKWAYISLFALILVLIFRKIFKEVSDTLKKNPRQSLLAGFLCYTLPPFAILILLITVLGIPLAGILSLLYIILWIMGGFMSSAILSSWFIDSFRGGIKNATGWKILLTVIVVSFLFTIISGIDMIAIFFAIGALVLYKINFTKKTLKSL